MYQHRNRREVDKRNTQDVRAVRSKPVCTTIVLHSVHWTGNPGDRYASCLSHSQFPRMFTAIVLEAHRWEHLPSAFWNYEYFFLRHASLAYRYVFPGACPVSKMSVMRRDELRRR
jgi:hypothetical protein